MASEVRARIAAEVRAEMARQNKTQQEIADVLGVDQGSVSKRVMGQRSFRAEELAALAEYLNVPITRFLPTATSAA